MKKYLTKTKKWVLTNKKMSGLFLLVLISMCYGTYTSVTAIPTETKYVLAQVHKGNVVVSVAGTGQVSSSNQVDLAPRASGDLIYLNATVGQEVKAGTLIAQVDAGNAAYELETAKLSYEDLVTVDPDDLRTKQNALNEAQDSLADAYVSARASVTSASTDMSDVLSGVNGILTNGGYLSVANRSRAGSTDRNTIDRAERSYFSANNTLKDLVRKYRAVSSSTTNTELETIVSESYTAAIAVAQAAKDTQDAVVSLRNHEAGSSHTTADQAYSTVTGLVSTANSVVSSLSSSKNAILNDTRSLETAQIDLKNLQDGPTNLELRSEELSLRQKQEALADYYVRAPFDGIIASVDGKKGQNVNSGTSIATLITKQKIAEISLNEIDAAKVKTGQKATLTFDAIDGLEIPGEVIEVDLIGTVTQGVVNYSMKIGFDSDDDRIKPGMTVSASIVTDMKENVLTVPASAIKTQGNRSFVLVPKSQTEPVQPQSVSVVVGLTGDDSVEIISGLQEGEQYVSRTITAAATTATTAQAPSLFGGGAARTSGAGGGFNRANVAR